MASKDIDEILDEQFKYLGVDPSTVPQKNLKFKIDMLGAVLEERQATLSGPESSKTGEARQRLELDATALNEMALAIRGKAQEVMIKKKAEEARKKTEEAVAGPSNTDQTESESIVGEQEDEEIDVAAWMATRTTDEERRADIEERFKRFWELADETKKFPKKIEDRKKWWDESKAALAQTLAQIKEFEPQRSVHQRGIRNQERLIADMSASLRALYAEHTVQHPATTIPATAARNTFISRTTSDPVRGTILRSTTVFTTAKPGHACFWPEIQHQTSLFLREGQHLRWQLRYEHNLHARHAHLQHATKERARRLREKVVEWDKQRALLYGALMEIEAMEAAAGIEGGATKAKVAMEEAGGWKGVDIPEWMRREFGSGEDVGEEEGKLEEGKLEEGKLEEGKLEEGKLEEGKLEEGKLEEGKLEEGKLEEGKLEEGEIVEDGEIVEEEELVAEGKGKGKAKEEALPPPP